LQPITNRDVEDNVGKHKFMIRSTVVSKDYTDEAESFVSKHNNDNKK